MSHVLIDLSGASNGGWCEIPPSVPTFPDNLHKQSAALLTVASVLIHVIMSCPWVIYWVCDIGMRPNSPPLIPTSLDRLQEPDGGGAEGPDQGEGGVSDQGRLYRRSRERHLYRGRAQDHPHHCGGDRGHGGAASERLSDSTCSSSVVICLMNIIIHSSIASFPRERLGNLLN